MKKDFISIKDLTQKEIEDVFGLTDELKKDKGKYSQSLKGKTLALIFQKPSNRTRVSFAVGMFQLGGQNVYLGPEEINLGVREVIKDVAKTLSRYVDGIVLRTFAHKNLIELSKYASVPVINGLSDLLHPCQALSDLYTIREKLGGFKGKTLAYVGDGNNVAHSLLYGCAKAGLNIRIATPKEFEPNKEIVDEAKRLARQSLAKIKLTYSPQEACKNVDVIYTDVWTSMGQGKEEEKRKKIFENFQVNKKLLEVALPKCLIMHCLPARRGQEITDEVIDSKRSIVFDQAENRLHVQKAILIRLLGKPNLNL
jgi:ornithine carbamoyltransferase